MEDILIDIPSTKDGKQTRMYRKWNSMVSRCEQESHPAFPYYGGRGIKVCRRWRLSYTAFHRDMGEAPPGYWIDRIDGSKGYEPGNCRWVTPIESARNRRKRVFVVDPTCLKQKAKAAGLPYHVVYKRIKLHMWPEEKALTTPVRAKRKFV